MLSRQHALRLQYLVQSTLRFRIAPTHPCKHHLKATGSTRSPFSTADVATIQTDRDRRSGFGRGFDLELASGIVNELFRAPCRPVQRMSSPVWKTVDIENQARIREPYARAC
jgi:hypothetical protein